MKKLFESADRYLQESDWTDLGMIKICLFSMGVVVGLLLPAKAKKRVLPVVIGSFMGTYIPLMMKYFKIVKDM